MKKPKEPKVQGASLPKTLMKFKKKDLQDMVYDEGGPLEPIEDDVIDSSRWSIQHSVVFKDTRTEKYYKSYYSVGATEMQCEAAYEYDSKEIECGEVELKEITVKKWVGV